MFLSEIFLEGAITVTKSSESQVLGVAADQLPGTALKSLILASCQHEAISCCMTKVGKNRESFHSTTSFLR